MGTLLDELLALRVPRAGGVAWEYYFAFGGGHPPWVSGLAQGTGIQSIARVAQRTGRKDEVLPIAHQGLGVFKTATPEGVRVPTADGAEYALYSFAPDLRVINGFVQALVGLYDLGKIAGDADAQALYVDGERVARRELPTFDTGAWSLYSRGSIEHESDLSYHQLLRAFLRRMCTRTTTPCTATRSCASPSTSSRSRRSRSSPRGCAAARSASCACGCRRSRASGCAFSRGGKVVSTRAAVVVGHGTPALSWAVPRKAGDYDVRADRGRPGGQRRHGRGYDRGLEAEDAKRAR